MDLVSEWIRDEMERQRREFLAAVTLDRLRWLWDNLPDDGGAIVEGDAILDCDDIHAELTRRGDGSYCDI